MLSENWNPDPLPIIPRETLAYPVNQELQAKRARGWVNRRRSPPVWAGSMLLMCVFVTDPSARRAFASDPAAAGTRRKIGELCVGLVSWEWLWIFNCKVNRRLTARVANPSRKQSQGWFTVQSWHARTYWETILLHYWFYPWFLNTTSQGLNCWPAHGMKALCEIWLPATNCSCAFRLFELPKPLSRFTRGALTPVNANVISAPRVVNGPECRTVVSWLPWMW